MQLAPNGSIIDGVVRQILTEKSGFGRELVVDVKDTRAARGKKDFLNAAEGDRVTLFLAAPLTVEIGQRYRILASVLGGPNGQRTVIESLSKKAG